MEFHIPEIDKIFVELNEIKEKFNNSVSTNKLCAEWYNDKQCWELKGGMALNTYRNNRFFQCKGGIPDGFVGGRKVWSKKSVEEWLPLTDLELEEYHLKYKTGAKRKSF